MTITNKDVYSGGGVVLLDLTVEVSGMDITVKAGAFKAAGGEHELLEDVVFIATNRVENAWLDGYLVKAKDDGEIGLLIDERLSDGVTSDDAYQWEGGPYEQIIRVFEIHVPGGSSSLETLELQVNRVLERPVGMTADEAAKETIKVKRRAEKSAKAKADIEKEAKAS